MPQKGAEAPTQVTAWTGRPGNLVEWGHGKDYVYGLLAPPDSQEGLLVLWGWQGQSMMEVSASVVPPSAGGLALGCDHVCGLVLGSEKGLWPYALVTSGGDRILKKWDVRVGWSVRAAGASMNGRFIALIEADCAIAPDYESGKDRTRVGVIDVTARELKWVEQLVGTGVGTARQIAVTDDGRYVAIAGWRNGTAMVDAEACRVLWAKRPEDEVSTGYAGFAPDGKVVYTAGSGGCVYGMEVETGNILSRRWATSKGEPIYGHRVSSLAISGDGKWLAAGTGPEGQVYVWNLEHGGSARVFDHGHGSIAIVGFSPGARSVVSVGGGLLKVWQIAGAIGKTKEAP